MRQILPNLMLLVFIMIAATTSDSKQQVIPGKPGWHELSNTKVRSVCPPKGFGGSDYNFLYYCKNVTAAWSGGAFDTKRDQLYIWGGGHNDYYGNEIYSLDLIKSRITRLTDPVVPTARRKERIADSELAPFDGTQPNGRHTYDGLVYIPHVDKMWAFSGSLASKGGGGDNITWLFDPKQKTWQKIYPKGDIPEGALGVASAYDPLTKRVFLHDRHNLYTYQYDSNGGIYTRLNNREAQLPYGTNAALDPKRRKLVLIGRGFEYVYDIGPGSQYVRQDLQSTGDKSIIKHQAPGLAYDPIDDKLVGWAGGNKIYTLNLDSFEWTSIDYPNGPDSQPRGGTYGRWDYVPNMDVFALYNKVDENGFVFRPLRGKASNAPPSVPKNLHTTSILPYKVELAWKSSKDNIGILGYQVYRNGILLASTQETKFSDLLVSAGEEHVYSVSAMNFAKIIGEKSTPLLVRLPRNSIKPLGDCSNETLLADRNDIVFCEPWENEEWWKQGYLNDPIVAEPRIAREKDKRDSRIVKEDCISGKCLKVPMKKGQTGSLSLYWPLANAQLAPEQIFLRYYLRLGPDWNPKMCNKDGSVYGHGGKFPGPADPRTWADPSGQCGNGGNPSDGINCWSMRAGFRSCESGRKKLCATKPGAITLFGSYIYHPGQKNATGASGYWDSDNWGKIISRAACDKSSKNMSCGIGDGGVLLPDRWYRIEMQVTMNTPGKPDGIIRGWVDGVLSYEKKNTLFRLPEHDNLHNRLIWLNVYKGGTKGNCNDSEVYLDQMVIAMDAPPGGIDTITPFPPRVQ